MAWKRSTVRTRPGPPFLQQLTNSLKVLKGANASAHLPFRQQQLYNPCGGVSFLLSEWRKLCHPIILPSIPAHFRAGRILFLSKLSGLNGFVPFSRNEANQKSVSALYNASSRQVMRASSTNGCSGAGRPGLDLLIDSETSRLNLPQSTFVNDPSLAYSTAKAIRPT